jgi:hypothetical protein
MMNSTNTANAPMAVTGSLSMIGDQLLSPSVDLKMPPEAAPA